MKVTGKMMTAAALALCILLSPAAALRVQAASAEYTGNDWILPVSNYTSLGCSFGCKCVGGHDAVSGGHKGYDVRAGNNTMVLASRGGTVVSTSNSCKGSHFPGKQTCYCANGVENGGNHVKIRHSDGKYTIYFHMRTIAVNVGQQVRQGDIIGWVGTTGYSTGNHVCMEYRKTDGKTGTAFIDTLVEDNAATNKTGTGYGLALREAVKTVGVYARPSTSSTKLGEIRGTEADPKEMTVSVIQENYGFVTCGDLSGWVYLPNTVHKDRMFQLRYYANGGTGYMETELCPESSDYELTPATVSKEGNVLTGWTAYRPFDATWLCTDGTDTAWYAKGSEPSGWKRMKFADGGIIPGEIDMCNSKGNQVIKLFAVWAESDPVQYTLEYLPGEGEGTMEDQNCTVGTAVKLAACTFTREDYLFAGWNVRRESDDSWLYVPDDGSEAAAWYQEDQQPEGWSLIRYADKATLPSLTKERDDVISLYAQWAASFILLDAGKVQYSFAVDEGEPLGKMPIPVREGYHFLGWYTEEQKGELVTSLDTVDTAEQDTLYAHWISVEKRPMLETYLTRAKGENSYTLALSQLLSASGQQEDGGYTYEQCREDLDSVGMLTESGGVKNSSFDATAFLEHYGPELTWDGRYVRDSYEDYVTGLAEQMEDRCYILLCILREDGTKVWRYLYEADGQQLTVVDNGQLTDVTELGDISSANLFRYHGTPRPMQFPRMTGAGIKDGDSMEVALEYRGSELVPEEDYQLWLAYYSEDGQMLGYSLCEEMLGGDLSAAFDVDCPEQFSECLVYLWDEDLQLLCDVLSIAVTEE